MIKLQTHPPHASGRTRTHAERVERGQVAVLVRLGPAQLRWLDSRLRTGEGRATAIKRLAGVPVEEKQSQKGPK